MTIYALYMHWHGHIVTQTRKFCVGLFHLGHWISINQFLDVPGQPLILGSDQAEKPRGVQQRSNPMIFLRKNRVNFWVGEKWNKTLLSSQEVSHQGANCRASASETKAFSPWSVTTIDSLNLSFLNELCFLPSQGASRHHLRWTYVHYCAFKFWQWHIMDPEQMQIMQGRER